jgi:uncharacterized protein YjbI with pentapeptide repeats
MFFLSLFSATSDNGDVSPNVVSLVASYDAALQTLAQEIETQPLPVDLSSDLEALKQEVETAPRLEIGTIASQNADNVNITGGEISGLSLPLPVASGGTGQSTFTNGQLLIGNTTGNTLNKATLTAGSNITITNGAGAITIDASFGSATASGVNLATFSGTLPAGSATSTNLWAQVTIGGTDYWLPIWAV